METAEPEVTHVVGRKRLPCHFTHEPAKIEERLIRTCFFLVSGNILGLDDDLRCGSAVRVQDSPADSRATLQFDIELDCFPSGDFEGPAFAFALPHLVAELTVPSRCNRNAVKRIEIAGENGHDGVLAWRDMLERIASIHADATHALILPSVLAGSGREHNQSTACGTMRIGAEHRSGNTADGEWG